MTKKEMVLTEDEVRKYETLLNFLETEFDKKKNYSTNVTSNFSKNNISKIKKNGDFIAVEFGDNGFLNSPAYAYNIKEHIEMIYYVREKLGY